MYIINQVSLSRGEKLFGICSLEITLRSFGFFFYSHGEHGTLSSQAFKDDCHTKEQNLFFSCMGAYHQYGVAEHSIQTVVEWARDILLYSDVHWQVAAYIQLRPFAMQLLE